MACKQCNTVADMAQNHVKVQKMLEFVKEFQQQDGSWAERTRKAAEAVYPGLGNLAAKKRTEFIGKRRDLLRRHLNIVNIIEYQHQEAEEEREGEAEEAEDQQSKEHQQCTLGEKCSCKPHL